MTGVDWAHRPVDIHSRRPKSGLRARSLFGPLPARTARGQRRSRVGPPLAPAAMSANRRGGRRRRQTQNANLRLDSHLSNLMLAL